MTITYRNTFRDRLAFAGYHLPRNPLVLLMTVGMVLLFTFQILLPAAREATADKPLAVRIMAFGFMEFLLLAFVVVFWAVITVLTMVSRRNKPLYCQRSLTIGEEGFISESEYGRSETRWPLVQKLARTRSHIFMYLNQQSAVVIPRRVFVDKTQWDAFYEICRRSTKRVV